MTLLGLRQLLLQLYEPLSIGVTGLAVERGSGVPLGGVRGGPAAGLDEI